MIKSLFLIVYLYCVLPLLIGVATSLLVKHRINLSQIYLTGYIVYLAIFSLVAAWELRHYASYADLVQKWKIMIYVLTILVLLCISIVVGILKRQSNTLKKSLPFTSVSSEDHSAIHSRERQILAGLTLILIILAVLFLIPQAFDETPELARLSLTSDSFFSIDPATGSTYKDSSACPGCLHLFYAFGSSITGIDVTTLIHLMMPIFMIPLFVCAQIAIARILFPKKVENQFSFVLLIALFYFLMLPLEAHVALAPYRNIWNGITLSASCLLPLFVAVCLNLVRCFLSDNSISAFLLLNNIAGLVFLILVIRLCTSLGLVVCSLFVLSTIVIALVSSLMRRRSNNRISIESKGGDPL